MKKLFIAAFAIVLFASCEKEEDPFLIDGNRVGHLTRDVKVYQLDSIFANDSLAKRVSESDYFGNSNEIKVIDREGKQLLLLEPVQAFDSTSTIGHIQILDPRFETSQGLGTKSTFKDIQENYTISRIENTLNAAVVFINDLDIYITIDKKELPSELRYDTSTKIQASQIPDDAKFKYFMIGWD